MRNYELELRLKTQRSRHPEVPLCHVVVSLDGSLVYICVLNITLALCRYTVDHELPLLRLPVWSPPFRSAPGYVVWLWPQPLLCVLATAAL